MIINETDALVKISNSIRELNKNVQLLIQNDKLTKLIKVETFKIELSGSDYDSMKEKDGNTLAVLSIPSFLFKLYNHTTVSILSNGNLIEVFNGRNYSN